MGKGVRSFYLLTDALKESLLGNVNVNTVTYGDITKIDLKKQTIYPLSHINVGQVASRESVLVYTISIFAMDLVDVNKAPEEDIFVGNDNTHDVLNTQLAVLVKLTQDLRIGLLRGDGWAIEGEPVLQPFTDRFEQEVSGWMLTLDILAPNDVLVC